MPKLIIKQNNSVASQQSSMATWLSVGGLLVLLAVVAAGAFFFTKTPLPGSELEPLAFSSSTNESATNSYQSLHAILGDLMTEYEGLAARGVDDYQKNLMLQGKAESILGHLTKMNIASVQLGLDAKESAEATDRHQFYKDFWQAKLHFRELRVSRFENTDAAEGDQQTEVKALAAEAQEQVVDTKDTSEDVETEVSKPKFQFAKPPEGTEMPAGFCDLGDPDNSCKPEAGAVAGSDLPALDNLALPNDLPALDDLALPEGLPPLSDGALLPLPDENIAVVDNGSQPKKLKFQFAKPPEGMEMPAGFCDLGAPDNSCKPGDAAMTASGLPALDDLTLPELPALDDLSLPELPPLGDLPLPDGDLLSDVDQPVLNGAEAVKADQNQL